MNLMLAKTPWVVIPIYPVVAAGGMLHASCLFAIVQLAVAIPSPSYGTLILCSLIYTAFLSAFFRIMDGHNLLFQAASLVVMSAIFSMVIYLVFFIVGQAITGLSLSEGSPHGWLGLATVVVSFVTGLAFIYDLGDHDLHEIGLSWILLSQLAIVALGLGYAMWEFGILQAMYHAIMSMTGGTKPAPKATPH